jgi:beta-1,4-mannosyltransferase
VSRMSVASWPGYGATTNPFVSIFLDGLKQAGCEVISIDHLKAFKGQAPDILLLHWADRVYWYNNTIKTSFAILFLLHHLRRRSPRTKVVWLVHNIKPHDAGPVRHFLWGPYIRAFARQVDGFLTLSPGTIGEVRSAFPELATAPADYVWHPSYPGAELSCDERLAARALYGWNDTDSVLGYCGLIRPYKGMEELVGAFLRTSRTDLRLLVAGRPYDAETATWLEAAAAQDTRIKLDLRYLTNSEFRQTLGACDVMLAPFREYLHSGSIVHALSANRPVVTPVTPFSESMREQLGGDWMRTYSEKLTPALLEASETLSPPTTKLNMAEFKPDAVGRRTAGFFERVLRGASSSALSGLNPERQGLSGQRWNTFHAPRHKRNLRNP